MVKTKAPKTNARLRLDKRKIAQGNHKELKKKRHELLNHRDW